MLFHISVLAFGLWQGVAIPPDGNLAGPAGQEPGQAEQLGSGHPAREPDLRLVGARTECTWVQSAAEQLNYLRMHNQGTEPTWLAVLHRIQARNLAGYHRWCSGYLRRLRSQFGRELNSHLHHRRLNSAEIRWAARVEHAAYQDFLHYVHNRRDVVACLAHLPSDEVILATRPTTGSPHPMGIFHADWVNRGVNVWGTSGSAEGSSTTGPEAGSREPGSEAAGPSEASSEEVEEDVTALFQLPSSVEARWHRLIDALHDWAEEGLAAGLAVRMAREVARRVEDAGFLSWAVEPLHTLGAGIPFSEGSSPEVTPPRLYAWARDIVDCLLICYRAEQEQGEAPAMVEDEMSLMDRDRRYSAGRRRYRDSRSPRRGARPTCSASSRTGTYTSRAERVAARQTRGSGIDRRAGRHDEEYVEVHLEEAPNTTVETRGLPSTASGSHGPPRPSEADGEARERPVERAAGRGEVALPHPRHPMTLTQATDLWRYLLFSRTALGPALAEGSQLPDHWLPASMIGDICRTHEGMSTANRGISTLALMRVLRFLAQELTQTIQQADAIARSREVGRRHGEPEEDDTELLLQVGIRSSSPAVDDATSFMQGFFHTDGHDSMQQRWTRCLLRLQKELVGQRKDQRRAHTQGILAALRAAPGGPMGSDWGEQLQALLLVLLDDTEEVESGGRVNVGWLQPWLGEISAFVPGLQMWNAPVMVDSQPQSTSSVSEHHQVEAPLDQEIEELLQDEDDERELRRREADQEQERQADHERLCALEVENLRREASNYRAWEDGQIQRFLQESSQPTGPKKRCVLQVELSSGSGDAPVKKQILSMEVPEDGASAMVVVRARMEPDPDGVDTELVPSPVASCDEAIKASAVGTVAAEGVSSSLERVSQMVHHESFPDLLPHLDFREYEHIYEDWCRGGISLEEVTHRFGRDTAEMIQAQHALCKEVETELEGATQMDGGDEAEQGDD